MTATESTETAEVRHRHPARRRARSHDRLARLRRPRRRPPRRLRRLRRRRPARRPGPRPGHQVEEGLRRGDAVELLEPGPDRIPDGGVHGASPAPAPLAGPPLRAPARRQAGAGRRGAAPDRRPRGLRARADRAGRRAVALPQQARVLVRRARTASSCSASTPAAAGTRSSTSTTACSPPRRQRGRATTCATGPAREASPPTTRTTTAACCATWSSARAGAPARSRPAWSPPAPTSREPPVDLHTVDRGPLRRHRRPDRRARRGAPARGARRPRLRALPRRLLPDQHRDGRAALRASPPSSPASTGSERLFDLYCGIGTIGLTHGRRRPARSGAWRSSPRRSPTPSATPSRNEIANAQLRRRRRPHRDAAADRGGRQARRRRRRPAARRPLAEDRPPGDRVRGASGSSTSPATRRRWRRTPPSWSRPAIGSTA